MRDVAKILTIIGARPQFIKAAAVSRAFRAAAVQNPGLAEVIVHTGQHFDDNMSKIFFDELGIPKPAHTLSIHGGGHGQMTGRMLEALEAVMLAERPAAVMVYGDTNSTLAGALAAAKLHIPLIHVEAGLRSFNRRMPEEINRVLTDHISTLLFCPTRDAVKNLTREGITKGVHHVGDVMFDATLFAKSAAASTSNILQTLSLRPQDYAVATVHRAENTDDEAQMRTILAVLEEAARRRPVVWPVHPRTRQVLNRLSYEPAGVLLTEPLGYLDLQRLLSDACEVFTDSGGLQKEAYFLRVPCVTLRSETEWVETIEHGWNRLWTEPLYKERSEIDEYGNGDAAGNIVGIIRDHFALP
jgi:UDP-GlcNAc3NAcA epimerase